MRQAVTAYGGRGRDLEKIGRMTRGGSIDEISHSHIIIYGAFGCLDIHR